MEQKVTIIGGGPAGLSAAIYLARASLKPLVFTGDSPGGQLMLTSEIENYPGARSLMGSELIMTMREQAEHFGSTLVDATVNKVVLSPNKHTIFSESPDYREFNTQTLLIATGAKALWIGLDSETALRGKGVSSCATCDGFFFRNKRVAVVGGGDTALEEAIQLTKFASVVYIVHRRDSFRASDIMKERVMQNGKIKILWNQEVLEILGPEKVEGIRLKDTTTGEKKDIPLEGVFVAIGHKPDTDLFKDKLILDKHGYIVTFLSAAERKLRRQDDINLRAFENADSPFFSNTSTNVMSVFAAGDCVDRTYKQASTASGMGVAAALDIERYIEQQKR